MNHNEIAEQIFSNYSMDFGKFSHSWNYTAYVVDYPEKRLKFYDIYLNGRLSIWLLTLRSEMFTM